MLNRVEARNFAVNSFFMLFLASSIFCIVGCLSGSLYDRYHKDNPQFTKKRDVSILVYQKAHPEISSKTFIYDHGAPTVEPATGRCREPHEDSRIKKWYFSVYLQTIQKIMNPYFKSVEGVWAGKKINFKEYQFALLVDVISEGDLLTKRENDPAAGGFCNYFQVATISCELRPMKDGTVGGDVLSSFKFTLEPEMWDLNLDLARAFFGSQGYREMVSQIDNSTPMSIK